MAERGCSRRKLAKIKEGPLTTFAKLQTQASSLRYSRLGSLRYPAVTELAEEPGQAFPGATKSLWNPRQGRATVH